ncbi:MAG: HAD family hydrolase [Solirubrobacterales bacterium]
MVPRSRAGAAVAAVIFDLDGVLVDSESAWGEIRERFTKQEGGSWRQEAVREMQGMSSTEWSRYMRDQLGVPLPPEDISSRVADEVAGLYRQRLPLLPGAVDAVRSLAATWPLAVASSANRGLVDLVLELAGLESVFRASVSSEEVDRGKPAPDVYVEAARRLGVDSAACVAVEDSTNGIRSAHQAGMAVIAIPNRDFPPGERALKLADRVLDSLAELTPDGVYELG